MSLLSSSKSTSYYLISFAKQLETLGYKQATVKMAVGCVGEFLTQMERLVTELTANEIVKHREYLQTRPKQRGEGCLSEQMISHHMYSLKLFFNYLLEIKALEVHPMNTLSFKAPEKQERGILTQEEIKQLYAACDSYKEKALLGIYYGCGLRRSEGVNLTLKDIHFKDGLLYVREGKGGKRRVVPMNNKIVGDIKNYVLYERFNPNGEQFLLLNKIHRKMSGNKTNKLFQKLLKKGNIDKQVSLHNLRHSIATHLLANGMKVEQVREFLGHSTLESTQVYTRVLQRV